jgi:hypothetical protein
MKALKIITVNILIFFALLLLLEVTGQIITLLRPSYEVLFLQPDKKVGWKQVPNLSWPATGQYWYAADFSIQVETNPLGFRDIARKFSKSEEVKRVALLGDSFIEAVQVPFEKTAGYLLEQRLNTSLQHTPNQSEKWEVLNFGISNYGVGQYLLTWEEHAKKYAPDYVAIFVALFHMTRTVKKFESGAFSETRNKRLWVRPIFRIENDRLVRLPAADFDKFVKAQEHLIRVEFGGQRMRRRTQLITLYYAKRLLYHIKKSVKGFNRRYAKTTPASKHYPVDSEILSVNLKVIEVLGRKVESAGSRLIVLDASRYFGDHESVSSALKELSEGNGFGYIPLYEHLLKANANGISTQWAHDYHFNEAGNVILANALYDWIAQNSYATESQ